jgi:hypothetical protein
MLVSHQHLHPQVHKALGDFLEVLVLLEQTVLVFWDLRAILAVLEPLDLREYKGLKD